MGIWNAITANPDVIIGILSVVAGWLGIDRWRRNVRESTAAEVDRWGSVVAAGVVLAIKSGLFRAHEDAMDTALERFRVLANVAGVKIKPEHERKVMAVFHKAFIAAGVEALENEAAKLHILAEAAMARMATLPVLP